MSEFFELEHERVVREVLREGHKLVAIQLPEALKKYSSSIVRVIEERTGANVVVLGDKCYGSCCLAFSEAEMIGATLLVHYGHTPYPGLSVPSKSLRVMYVPCYAKFKVNNEIIDRLTEFLRGLRVKNVAIASTIQEYRELENIRHMLSKRGFNAVIGKGKGMPKGVVLGCDYSSIDSVNNVVEAIVLVCGGEFHPLGASLRFSGKPVIQLDPYKEEVCTYESLAKRILSIRYKRIIDAIDSRRWAIWVGLHPGQRREGLVKAIEERARGRGYECFRVYSRYISKDELYNIDSDEIDIHIITSCPRLPIDDLGSYQKPVLTPGEAFMILENKMSRYIFPW